MVLYWLPYPLDVKNIQKVVSNRHFFKSGGLIEKEKHVDFQRALTIQYHF